MGCWFFLFLRGDSLEHGVYVKKRDLTVKESYRKSRRVGLEELYDNCGIFIIKRRNFPLTATYFGFL